MLRYITFMVLSLLMNQYNCMNMNMQMPGMSMGMGSGMSMGSMSSMGGMGGMSSGMQMGPGGMQMSNSDGFGHGHVMQMVRPSSPSSPHLQRQSYQQSSSGFGPGSSSSSFSSVNFGSDAMNMAKHHTIEKFVKSGMGGLSMGNKEIERLCKNLKDGKYTVLRMVNKKIYFFYQDMYYLFRQTGGQLGQRPLTFISYGQVSELSDIGKHGTVEKCFTLGGRYYCKQGAHINIYDDHLKLIASKSYDNFYHRYPHVVISKYGEASGFFIPPGTHESSNLGHTQSQTNGVSINSSGGSVQTQMVNGNIFITYRGYSIPPKFNTYITDDDGRVLFFNGDEYAIISPHFHAIWHSTKEFIGCHDS